MQQPLKIALGAVVAVIGLGTAYLAGTRTSKQTAATEHAVPSELTASLEDVDYDRLVDCIAAIRSRDGDIIQFQGAVDTLHQALLGYVAQRFNLTGEERALMIGDYTATSSSLLLDYQQMMGELRSDSVTTATEPIVSYSSYNSVNDFVGIFSGHACSLLSFPGRAQLEHASRLVDQDTLESAMSVRSSCRSLLSDAIAPIARSLREKAVIRDLNTSKMQMESRVRSMVVELATAEERLSADFTDIYQTKFLFMQSEATLRARVDATVKVGFDLNKRFSIEMDHTGRLLTVRLPEPEVLSNEVEVEFVDVKNGTLVKIDREKYNAALVHAREMMDEQVAGSGVFVTAKHNAGRIIRTVFEPMMVLPEFRYEVDVLFPRGYRAPAAKPVDVVEAKG